MNGMEMIKARRSIRKYTNQVVPEDLLEKVIEAANWAPSNGNSQPWKFIVTKGKYVEQVCNVFYEWAKDYIPNAPYIPAEKKPHMLEYAKNFGGAPNHIIVTYQVTDDPLETEEALMAASAAVQNLCLAATAEGLGTVWIAGHVAHDTKTREALGIEEGYQIAGIIPIGYPDQEPPTPPRENPKEKTTWLGY